MQIVDAGKAVSIVKSHIDTAEDVDLDTKVELELLENVEAHHNGGNEFVGYKSPPEDESIPSMMTAGQHHDEVHNKCVKKLKRVITIKQAL